MHEPIHSAHGTCPNLQLPTQDAHEAFQAVATAAKTLQDSGARGALDAAREDVELRKAAIAAAQAEERARQWRVARGEEPAGGRVLPDGLFLLAVHRRVGMKGWRGGWARG